MCKICRNEYNEKDELLFCCKILKEIPVTLVNLKELYIYGNMNIKKIPKTLVNLELLNCSYSIIKSIPKTFVKLKHISCIWSNLKKIPRTFVNLENLYCAGTCISYIPNTLINLRLLYFEKTHIKFIPETFTKLKYFGCDDNVILSPKNVRLPKKQRNLFSLFVKLQIKIRTRFMRKKINFAFMPLYLIGQINKKQLNKMFNFK